MKKWICALSIILINYASSLHCEEYTDNADEPLSFKDIESGDFPPNFFHFDLDWNWITRAKFTTPEEKGNQIGYSEGELNFSYVKFSHPYDGYAVSIGYSRSHVDWTHNPFFRENVFSKFLINYQIFTKRIPRWEWRLGVLAAFDTSHIDFYDHTIYDLLVWGRYAWENPWCGPEIGLNIGFIGRAGIDKNWIIPIIGFDIEQEKLWKIHFIYPVDMVAAYYLTDEWSVDIAARIWNTRYRVSKIEPLSQGIWEYRNSGIEVGLNYECSPMLAANIHVGSTLGSGDMKICTKNNHTVRHNKFGSSLYAGTTLDIKF